MLATARSVFHEASGTGLVRLTAFFSGFPPTAVGYFLQGATKFGGYELCKRTVLARLNEAGELGEAVARNFQLPIMLASAACAETFASAALCPLEVLKLRMQTSPTLAALGLRSSRKARVPAAARSQ